MRVLSTVYGMVGYGNSEAPRAVCRVNLEEGVFEERRVVAFLSDCGPERARNVWTGVKAGFGYLKFLLQLLA